MRRTEGDLDDGDGEGDEEGNQVSHSVAPRWPV